MSFEENSLKVNFLFQNAYNAKIVWPPSDYCDHCFGKIELKKQDFEAKIVEFSKKNDDYFCIVEIENSLRIIAKSYQIPTIGKNCFNIKMWN